MDDLTKKEILKVTSGKNSIYWYNQELQEHGDVDEMQQKFNELQNISKEKDDTLKKLNFTVKDLKSQMPDTEIDQELKL